MRFEIGVDLDDVGGERERPARRHRVARVVHEVPHRLGQPRPIGVNQREVWRVRQRQRDLRGPAARAGSGSSRPGAPRGPSPVARASAAVRTTAADRSASRPVPPPCRSRPRRGAIRDRRGAPAAAARPDRQSREEIVEIVSDSAGEPAHRCKAHGSGHGFGVAGDVHDPAENGRLSAEDDPRCRDQDVRSSPFRAARASGTPTASARRRSSSRTTGARRCGRPDGRIRGCPAR